MPSREKIIATGGQKIGRNLDWRIWEGFMEKLAYELRLKKEEVKETFIWGQKGEKMHSRQRKQPELDLKPYREFPGGEAQTDQPQSEWKWEEGHGRQR